MKGLWWVSLRRSFFRFFRAISERLMLHLMCRHLSKGTSQEGKKIFEKISHSAERRKIETLTILKDQNLLAKVNRCGVGGNERFAEQQMERKPSEWTHFSRLFIANVTAKSFRLEKESNWFPFRVGGSFLQCGVGGYDEKDFPNVYLARRKVLLLLLQHFIMPADLKVSLAVNFLRINQKRLFTLPFLVCPGEGLRSKKMKRKSLEMPESSVETSSGRLWKVKHFWRFWNLFFKFIVTGKFEEKNSVVKRLFTWFTLYCLHNNTCH